MYQIKGYNGNDGWMDGYIMVNKERGGCVGGWGEGVW